MLKFTHPMPPIDPDWMARGGMDSLPHSYAESRSGGAFVPYPHLKHVSGLIGDSVWSDAGGRIIVNLPPGVGKSHLLTYWTPIWYLEWWPRRRVICVSHNGPLAEDFGRRVRNECEQNPAVGVKLSDDSTSAGRWHTVQGGGMVAMGVGGGLTGWRANLILVDDPYPDWASAQSATYQRHLEEWWEGVLMQRLEPGGTICVVHHRLNARDLTDYLRRKSERWRIVSLPTIAEQNDPMVRQPGEP